MSNSTPNNTTFDGATEIDLSAIGNVAPTYRHHDRFVTSGAPLILPGAFLKWYELRQVEARIPRDVVADARSVLTQDVSNGQLVFDYGLGFVVLHYSPPLAYLIVGSWRDNQEFWETLYVRNLTTDEPFTRVEPGTNAPTLCVWELAPVWHERQAWTRFLYSARDTPAKRSWVSDCLSGRV
jgi:hypothetical protein